jgi:hypothetical protein
MAPRPDTIVRWHAIAAELDASALPSILAEDAVFRSPAVHAPQEGRSLTAGYLAAAFAVLGPTLVYRREWYAEGSAVLEFTADLGGLQVQGVDMITWGDDGLITEFTVMVRPVRALMKLIELMAARLQAD